MMSKFLQATKIRNKPKKDKTVLVSLTLKNGEGG